MLFADDIKKEDTYSLCDVFSRDKYFYKNSVVRVVGWETPVSVFYRDGHQIKMRFKSCIKIFSDRFTDSPYEGDPSDPLYDIHLEKYKSERHIRRLRYYIGKYKEAGVPFEATAVVPAYLKSIFVKEGYLMQEEFVLNEDMPVLPLFDSDCLWTPVDVDAILTDFSNRSVMCREDAMLVYWDGNIKFGKVGFDGKFYDTGALMSLRKSPKAYEFSEGINECKMPLWFAECKLRTTMCFLRDYIVAPDNTCYDYEGNEIPHKTRHHRNVAFMNDIIKLFYKDALPNHYIGVYLQATIPEELTRFELDDVERIVVPHLATKNMLYKKALDRFLELKAILKKAGFTSEFELPFRNILELNKVKKCGGSGRGMCSEKLLENLKKLHKRAGNKKMSSLLCDIDLLKKEVAGINGR